MYIDTMCPINGSFIAANRLPNQTHDKPEIPTSILWCFLVNKHHNVRHLCCRSADGELLAAAASAVDQYEGNTRAAKILNRISIGKQAQMLSNPDQLHNRLKMHTLTKMAAPKKSKAGMSPKKNKS